MAAPPTTTPQSMGRAQSATTAVANPTRSQCRTWMRSTLGRIVELLEAPEHLQKAHEGPDGREHRGADGPPGLPPEAVVEVPADEGARRDRPGEFERYGHPPAVTHCRGSLCHVSHPPGPGAPHRRDGLCPTRCGRGRGTWPRTGTAASRRPRPTFRGRTARMPRCRPVWRS